MQYDSKGLNSKIKEIAKMFLEDLKTLRQIGEELNVSAMAIHKVLKRHGINTSKDNLNLMIRCDHCKTEFPKHRSRVRKSLNNFCSNECYRDFIKELNKNTIISRAGAMMARRVMKKYFGDLPDQSIVHHIDGNENNNHITNLMLLFSQADHLMIHRSYGNPLILFDGSKYFNSQDCLNKSKKQILKIEKNISDILSELFIYKKNINEGKMISKSAKLKELAKSLYWEIRTENVPTDILKAEIESLEK